MSYNKCIEKLDSTKSCGSEITRLSKCSTTGANSTRFIAHLSDISADLYSIGPCRHNHTYNLIDTNIIFNQT